MSVLAGADKTPVKFTHSSHPPTSRRLWLLVQPEVTDYLGLRSGGALLDICTRAGKYNVVNSEIFPIKVTRVVSNQHMSSADSVLQ